MKAVRYHGNRDVRVDDIDEPETRPGTVKVAPQWCGICGSDLHEYLIGPETIPAPGSPHPLTGETVPVVLGHEFAGRVVEVGDGVDGVAVGDAVAIEPVLRDNSCAMCRRGDYNLCPQLGFHGLSGGGGGLAERTVVPGYMVHVLPPALPTDIGALIEPMAVGWHAVLRAEFRLGETALVIGAGPIGLVTMLALRAAGAGAVIVAETTDARKEKAAALGADLVLDPTEADVAAEVVRFTGGGADAVFDAAGNSQTISLAIASVRKRGRIVNIALWEHSAEIDMMQFLFTEATLTNSCVYANHHPAVISALADGVIDAAPLITKRIALDDIVEGGLEELLHHRDRHVKILVHP